MDASLDAGRIAAPLRITYLVKQLELVLREEIERALRPFGVTPPQFNALVGLRMAPGMSSAEMARRTHVSAQAANELAASLLRKGFVERAADARNRRVLRMRLTELGSEVLASCEAEVGAVDARMLALLDEEQRVVLSEAVVACIAAMIAPDGAGA